MTTATAEKTLEGIRRSKSQVYSLACNDGGLSHGYTARFTVKPDAAPGGIVRFEMFDASGLSCPSMNCTTDLRGGRIQWDRCIGWGFKVI